MTTCAAVGNERKRRSRASQPASLVPPRGQWMGHHGCRRQHGGAERGPRLGADEEPALTLGRRARPGQGWSASVRLARPGLVHPGSNHQSRPGTGRGCRAVAPGEVFGRTCACACVRPSCACVTRADLRPSRSLVHTHLRHRSSNTSGPSTGRPAAVVLRLRQRRVPWSRGYVLPTSPAQQAPQPCSPAGKPEAPGPYPLGPLPALPLCQVPAGQGVAAPTEGGSASQTNPPNRHVRVEAWEGYDGIE